MASSRADVNAQLASGSNCASAMADACQVRSKKSAESRWRKSSESRTKSPLFRAENDVESATSEKVKISERVIN